MGRSKGSRKPKRHQHTVPRFYLRRFADNDGRFVRVPIQGDRVRHIAVGDATVRKDFYSFRDPNGEWNDSVEDALGTVESEAASVFRKVVEDCCWPLPSQLRETLAYWISIQHLRIPAQRQVNNEIADHLMKTLTALGGKGSWRRRMEAAAGGPVSDEDLDRSWKKVGDFASYEIEADAGTHLSLLGRLIPAVARALMDRTWVLVRFQRRSLIVSDHPVVQIPNPAIPSGRGQGLANALGVYVPLDRRVALLMFHGGSPDRMAEPSTVMAKELNQRMAWSARSAVFHHPEDDLAGIELPDPRLREIVVDISPEALIPTEDGSDGTNPIRLLPSDGIGQVRIEDLPPG